MIETFDFCVRIGATARAIAEDMDRVASDNGLAGGPASVLVAVLKSPEQTQVAYASSLVINDATLTRYIDRLEDLGLLERKRGRQDRRVVRLHLTVEGEKTARRLEAGYEQLSRRYTDVLSAENFAEIDRNTTALGLALVNRDGQA